MRNLIRYIYVLLFRMFCHDIFLRNRIIHKKKYKGIAKFKNINQGKRCFIIATGPSLTVDDIELVKNEITFGMNSITKIFKYTDWRPSYYGIQDRDVYKKLKEEILKYRKEMNVIFIGDTVEDYSLDAYYYYLDLQGHLLGRLDSKFSDNAFKVIYDGHTITYSLIQLAVYMGFKEIYLLGCDTNYGGDKTHFESYDDKPRGKGMPTGVFYDAIRAYEVAEKYTKERGIKIYNCTRGGMLEVFERKTLEEVICEKGKV